MDTRMNIVDINKTFREREGQREIKTQKLECREFWTNWKRNWVLKKSEATDGEKIKIIKQR